MTRDMERDELVRRQGAYTQPVKDYDARKSREGSGGGWTLPDFGGGGGGGSGSAADGWTAIAAIVLFLGGVALLYQAALVVQAYLLGLQAIAGHAAGMLHHPFGWASVAALIVALIASWRLTGWVPGVAFLHPALRVAIALAALLPLIPVFAAIGYAAAWLFSLDAAVIASLEPVSRWAFLPRRTPLDPVTGFAVIGAGLVFLADPARRVAWIASIQAAGWRHALRRRLKDTGLVDTPDIVVAIALTLALASIPALAGGTPFGLWPSIAILAATLFRTRTAWIAVFALLAVLAVREAVVETGGVARLYLLAPWAAGFVSAAAVAVWFREPDFPLGAAFAAHLAALVLTFGAGVMLGDTLAPMLKEVYAFERFFTSFGRSLAVGWLVSLILSAAAIAWLPRWFMRASHRAVFL